MLRGERVWFTHGDALYIEKARRNPGSTFVIGADALDRVLDPKWGPEVKTMLYEFVSLYTRFLVAPRIVNGKLITLDDVCDRNSVDFSIRNDLLFELTGVEPSEMSSSQIRGSGK